MPELPEVEVTRRSFADRIAGAQVRALSLGKPLRWPLGCEPSSLAGRQVRSVARRGKYLLVHLDEGVLLLHLGMSGSLQFAPSLPPRGVHDHFELSTSQGVLRLHDPRRFGAVVYAPSLEDARAMKLLGGLGVEPLEVGFDAVSFHRALKLRRSAIKQVLLAGDIVVGVGNIYASESLFRARIHPLEPAGRLGPRRCARLVTAVRETLAAAIEAGGSTLRDFVGGDGQPGYFQQQYFVYSRDGEPCRVCGAAVQRVVSAQRATFFCPRCQRRG